MRGLFHRQLNQFRRVQRRSCSTREDFLSIVMLPDFSQPEYSQMVRCEYPPLVGDTLRSLRLSLVIVSLLADPFNS